MGIWKKKYVLQSEIFGINENVDGINRNRIWLSDSNTNHYKNCEIFIQEILSSDDLWEITYEDREGIDFKKWGHIYWKTKL